MFRTKLLTAQGLDIIVYFSINTIFFIDQHN